MIGKRTTAIIALLLLTASGLVIATRGVSAQSGETPGWLKLASTPSDAWSIAPDGRDANVVYSHGPAGISRTTDGGATWEVCNGEARSLTVLSPPDVAAQGTRLFAATASGLRTSDDGCRTWRDVSKAGVPTVGPAINSLTPYPDNYDVLYAGMAGLGGLYRSIDGGNAWEPASAGLPAGSHITSLVAEPRRPEHVLVGLRFDTERHPPAYIYSSTDGGLTWRSSSRGINVMPNNGCRLTGLAWAGIDLYAATLYDGLYRSTDRGITWQKSATPQRSETAARAPGRAEEQRPVTIRNLTGTSAGVLLLSTGEGAFQSLDGGRSWVSFGPRELTGAPVLIGVEPNSGRIVAASREGAWTYSIAEGAAHVNTPTPGAVAALPPTPPPPPQLPTSTAAPPTETPSATAVPPSPTAVMVEGPKPSDPVPPGDPAISDFFPETGHSIRYGFRDFWKANGGLQMFGYPLTEEFVEDGTPVQYFERVRLEYRDGRVQLGLLGLELTKGTFFRTVPFFPSEDNNVFFGGTGHSMSGPFLEFWRASGRETIFGYPISESFNEDGSEYQWLERARFEWHPYLPEGQRIVLGNLGTEALKKRGWLR